MRFAEPYWLLVGGIVVLALFLVRVRGERLTSRALKQLSGARLVNAFALPSPFRRWLRVLVICSAVAAGFVALARPQKGMRWQTLDRKGTDLLLVIDTSKSMNADDVSPTRLERTKLAVQDLVARFPEDRIGLLAFAGDAYLESPMTLDHAALLETLSSFDTSTISRPGTDVGRAIDSAVSALKADSSSEKVMVLLSDGEDLEGQGLDAAKRASAAGITIHTVGVGTPAGELVPAKNDEGATIGVVRDASGTPVRSRLDEPGLRAIAQAGHGTYRPLGADGRGLDRLYAEALAPLSHVEKGAKLQRVYAEWFAVPLGLSLFGIVLDALLAFRPRKPRRAESASRRSQLTHSGAVAAAALALLLLLPSRAHASVQSAQKAYQNGKFEDAAHQYEAERTRHPKDARLAIDEGAAAYRAGHFDAAEASLTQALAVADPKLQQRVLYDLGDARYRLGTTTLKDAPEKTIERWKAAIASYDGALKLTPNDADARFNRDFVKRKLAELEQKQKPPPNKPQDKPNQDQKGNPKDKPSKSGGSSGQDQKQNQSGSNEKQGSSSGKGADKGKTAGKGQQPGSPDQAAGGQSGKPDPTQNGKNPDQSAKNGPPPAQQNKPDGSGDTSGKPDNHGEKLSPKDARALLNSLRGDERQVRFGNSNTPHDDDTSRKDW